MTTKAGISFHVPVVSHVYGISPLSIAGASVLGVEARDVPGDSWGGILKAAKKLAKSESWS